MRDMGIQPERYVVGNEFNSINPITGQPEFFLKKIFRRLRKAKQDIGRRLRKGAADISGYVAPIVGAMYGPAAGAAAGALLGQYKRENPGDPSQWGQMALRGGIAGLGANLASGQGLTLGGGMKGIYGQPGAWGEAAWDPMEIGKRFLQNPADMLWDSSKTGWNRLNVLNNFGGLGTNTVAEGSISYPPDLLAELGVDINQTVNAQKPILERIFGENKVLEWLIKFGASKYLGDIIKEENEEAERIAKAEADAYGERTNWDVYDSLINPGTLVQAPNTSETDYWATAANGGILDLDKGGELNGPGIESLVPVPGPFNSPPLSKFQIPPSAPVVQ